MARFVNPKWSSDSYTQYSRISVLSKFNFFWCLYSSVQFMGMQGKIHTVGLINIWIFAPFSRHHPNSIYTIKFTQPP